MNISIRMSDCLVLLSSNKSYYYCLEKKLVPVPFSHFKNIRIVSTNMKKIGAILCFLKNDIYV